MEQNYIIRAYKDGDEYGIFELRKAVYPDNLYDQEKWLRWWRWMYKENPTGNGWIWLAEDKGKIVGQAAIIPVLMKIGTKLVDGFQSIDTMTHPNYRHQGIYNNLALKAYAEASNDNVHIGYGFSNDNSYPIAIKKLKWIEMPEMQVMMKVSNWRNALKLKIRNKFLRIALAIGADLVFNKIFSRIQNPPMVEGLTITRITSFDERFDEFWNRICNQSQIMVVRKRDYLNWRYSTPDRNYSIFTADQGGEIRGYIVLQHKIQKGVKITTILDLMSQSQEIMHCLISRAVQEYRQEGTDVILYSSITNKSYHGILKRNGFIAPPFIKGGYFSIYSSSPFISKEFLSIPQNWLIQTGDSDAV